MAMMQLVCLSGRDNAGCLCDASFWCRISIALRLLILVNKHLNCYFTQMNSFNSI